MQQLKKLKEQKKKSTRLAQLNYDTVYSKNRKEARVRERERIVI